MGCPSRLPSVVGSQFRDVVKCFFEQEAPRLCLIGGDCRPVAESTTSRTECLGPPGRNQLVDLCFGKLDEKRTGSAIQRGEEGAVNPQAWEAHHRGTSHPGSGEQGFGETPEPALTFVGLHQIRRLFGPSSSSGQGCRPRNPTRRSMAGAASATAISGAKNIERISGVIVE
jgi:hypothetical protein